MNDRLVAEAEAGETPAGAQVLLVACMCCAVHNYAIVQTAVCL